MKRCHRILLVLLLALLTTGCQDQEVYSITLIRGGTHTLRPGDTVSGEIIVVDGEVLLDQGAQVTGSLFMLGGSVEINGAVAGDATLVGGDLRLGPQARVGGSVNVGGGSFERSPGATISGTVETGSVQVPSLPGGRDQPLAEQVLWSLGQSLLLALLALLFVRFTPGPSLRTARAIKEHPVDSGAMGLLVFLVAPALLVMMAFTILLIPLALLGILVFALLVAYGWAAIGLLIGRLLARRLRWKLSPPAAAFLGTLLLILAVDALSELPLLGIVPLALSAAVGLGAVLLTRFGLRIYVPAIEREQAEWGSLDDSGP